MENGTGVIFAIIVLVIVFGLIAFMIISFWKIFEKAGKPGWAAIVPIYNLVVWCEIIQRPGWWAALMLIPYIGIIWQVWATNLLVKKFGKDEGFTVGCVFYPLSFGLFSRLAMPNFKMRPLSLTAMTCWIRIL